MVETSDLTRLSNDNCSFIIEKLKPAAILVTISGYDKGDFGSAVAKELSRTSRLLAIYSDSNRFNNILTERR